MFLRLSAAIAALSLLTGPALAQGAKPTDPQIAHIAYTAGQIDIAAGKQALSKSQDPMIRMFAEEMVRAMSELRTQNSALSAKKAA